MISNGFLQNLHMNTAFFALTVHAALPQHGPLEMGFSGIVNAWEVGVSVWLHSL